MHLAEGVLPLPFAAGAAVLAAPALLAGIRWLAPPDPDERRRRRTSSAVATALVFTVTLVPIPVPVVGITSHLCATPLLGILLGPRALVLPSALSLAFQALFVGHGGLTTLGANVLSLGVVGPWTGYLVARALRALRLPLLPSALAGCLLGDVAVYAGDAGLLALALATPAQGVAHLFVAVLAGLAPVQAPLALLEGVLGGLAARHLAQRRALLVPSWLRGAALPLVAALAIVGLSGCQELRPADEAVLDRVASQAGRPPAPLFSLGDEVTLGAACLGCFLSGLTVGRAWSRLGRTDG